MPNTLKEVITLEEQKELWRRLSEIANGCSYSTPKVQVAKQLLNSREKLKAQASQLMTKRSSTESSETKSSAAKEAERVGQEES